MSMFARLAWGMLAALTALGPALASPPDRDTQEVLRYTLGESALAKYVQATRSLAALPDGIPGACEDDGPASASLEAMVARLDAVPAASAAIRSAGMTTREYVVFGWSVFHHGMAAWALDQPGGTLPPGTARANVDFYRKHAAELDGLAKLSRSRCGGDEEDDQED